MRPARATIILGCALALGATLSACREEEQNRVLVYDKGTYAGRADAPLSVEAYRRQRLRVPRQRGLGTVERSGGSGSRGAGARAPDVRPPAGVMGSAPLPLDALRRRGRHQSFN
jgi:hypothetical protein